MQEMEVTDFRYYYSEVTASLKTSEIMGGMRENRTSETLALDWCFRYFMVSSKICLIISSVSSYTFSKNCEKSTFSSI